MYLEWRVSLLGMRLIEVFDGNELMEKCEAVTAIQSGHSEAADPQSKAGDFPRFWLHPPAGFFVPGPTFCILPMFSPQRTDSMKASLWLER